MDKKHSAVSTQPKQKPLDHEGHRGTQRPKSAADFPQMNADSAVGTKTKLAQGDNPGNQTDKNHSKPQRGDTSHG